jgi:hypothetical protein
MSGFRPVVPNLTDPDLIGVEEPKATVATTKSNVVSNLTIVVSSIVVTIIVMLLIWQVYKMFTGGDTEQEAMLAARQYKMMDPPPKRRQEVRVVRREAPPRTRKEPLETEARETLEDSQDDAAMGHMIRPILKSGGRITDVFDDELNSSEPGSSKVEVVVEVPGNVALDDFTSPKLEDDGGPSYADLLQELSEDTKSVSFLEPEQSCNFVPKSGKNKGKACGGTVVGNGKCKAHNK